MLSPKGTGRCTCPAKPKFITVVCERPFATRMYWLICLSHSRSNLCQGARRGRGARSFPATRSIIVCGRARSLDQISTPSFVLRSDSVKRPCRISCAALRRLAQHPPWQWVFFVLSRRELTGTRTCTTYFEACPLFDRFHL